jgi:hypothetical protein
MPLTTLNMLPANLRNMKARSSITPNSRTFSTRNRQTRLFRPATRTVQHLSSIMRMRPCSQPPHLSQQSPISPKQLSSIRLKCSPAKSQCNTRLPPATRSRPQYSVARRGPIPKLSQRAVTQTMESDNCQSFHQMHLQSQLILPKCSSPCMESLPSTTIRCLATALGQLIQWPYHNITTTTTSLPTHHSELQSARA